MAPLQIFDDASLPQAASLADMLRSLDGAGGGEWSYQVSPAVVTDAAPCGIARGLNVFGPAETDSILFSNTQRMMETRISVLRDVVYSPNSAAILSGRRGLYEPSVRIILALGGQDLLIHLEPRFSEQERQKNQRDKTGFSFKKSGKIAIPVCGNGFHNYGHFFFDGLPIAYQLSQLLPAKKIRFVGGVLAGWQKEILRSLGMFESYREITRPTVFPRMVVSNHLAQHLGYPTRYIRPVFDRLRFMYGGTGERNRVVFLSRRSDTTRRVLVNRHEVETALAEAGVEIHHPEKMSIKEQIALMASSCLVIGELGAAMANIGFCEPGTAILDIQQAGFPDGYVRSACRILGLRWHVYTAEIGQARMEARTGDVPHNCFSIDIESLLDAMSAILQRDGFNQHTIRADASSRAGSLVNQAGEV